MLHSADASELNKRMDGIIGSYFNHSKLTVKAESVALFVSVICFRISFNFLTSIDFHILQKVLIQGRK